MNLKNLLSKTLIIASVVSLCFMPALYILHTATPAQKELPKVVSQKHQKTETKIRHVYNPILKRMAPAPISYTNYKLVFTDGSARLVGPDQYHFTEVGDTIPVFSTSNP